MGLLDYHGKNLLPSVWSSDGNLTTRFRAQIDDQLRHRFDYVTEALLVGSAVSHYWEWDSDVDVLLLVDDQYLAEAKDQSRRVSGHPLVETDNNVYFWPVKATVAPGVLAKHFGPVFSFISGSWYGKHIQDEMELRRPEGIIQYANWRLFRVKYSDDPQPYDWRILLEGFKRLDSVERNEVIDEIKLRIAKVDRNVTALLKNKPKDVWSAAEKFDQELTETEDVPELEVPPAVAFAILHRFRHEDLLYLLEAVDEQLQKYEQRPTRLAAKELKQTENLSAFRLRMLQLSDMIIQRQGGSANAIAAIYDQIQYLLENSRYVLTDMRRRRVAYRLYRRYYMGKQEE